MAFEIAFLIASIVAVIFLSLRCIVLSKALNKYQSIIFTLISDEMTKENIKIIVAAMYGLDVQEIDRRLQK